MKNSYIVAAVCSLLLVIWMVSGMVFESDEANIEASKPDNQASDALFKVAVQVMEARATQLFVSANGQVEPNRVVQVRAQTQGQVDAVFAQEGERIEQGEVIANIAMNDREIRLNQEQALLESRVNTLKRQEQLAQRNYQSQSDLDRAKAELKASQAAIASIELDIQHTKVVAPFTGTIERLVAEQGDFVQINAPVAVLLEQSPLLVTLPIAQQDINRLSMGNTAQISLSTGETVEGRLRYISPRANEQTRTFDVEIEIDNSDGKLRSGMSANARIATEEVLAHFISPALFSLGSDGDIGVKIVDSEDTVRFYPVTILQSNTQGAWVAGLPKQVRVITKGQGFVTDGNVVRVEELPMQESR